MTGSHVLCLWGWAVLCHPTVRVTCSFGLECCTLIFSSCSIFWSFVGLVVLRLRRFTAFARWRHLSANSCGLKPHSFRTLRMPHPYLAKALRPNICRLVYGGPTSFLEVNPQDCGRVPYPSNFSCSLLAACCCCWN